MATWSDPQAWPWWRPSTPQYPDTTAFEPGDLFLFSFPGDPTADKLRRGQLRLGYPEDSAAYTHAAIYIGSACVICEAVEPQVRLHLLPGQSQPPGTPAAAQRPTMLVRRVAGKTSEQRSRIAAEALRTLDTPYGFSDLKAIVESIRHRRPVPDSADPGMICSMLFPRAWSRAIPGARLPRVREEDPTAEPIILPAELAQTELLKTSDWTRLPV